MKRATSAVSLVLYIIILICCTGSSVMAQNSKKNVEELTNDELESEIARLKREQFLKAKSFKCNFENGNFASWENGKIQSNATKDILSLIFDSIDYKKRTGRLIGNQGSSDILVNTTFGGINLIEITGAGSFITTTIYMPSARDNIEDQFFAVHSRHIAPLLDLPMSSQYYGKCKIWDINR